MPLRTYLTAIAIFCNEVKGKSALALSRDLGCQYKSAYVLAHKLREAMSLDVGGLHLGGVHGGDKPGQWSVGAVLTRAE
jgi:hypothetical protein